ncbi:MAG: Abi family protein [Anaerovibrio sp.]|uniref:Abi family protein n=1 Tax=Anaerovibrio sp. TaxID=1872532 RepID=UPI0025D20867|nr:Abi family protein [Anaerovibrio sp.]MCR5177235.1 Abi family protein [Anaerovibrio sp.]
MGNRKLTLEGQIQQMKSQNIGFSIVNEAEAIEYLSNHTYYFRLKFYAENYEKTKLPGVGTRYLDLEFAYLKELSLMDLYYRRVMFNIVQDIEHYAKIRLIKSVTKNKKEDGYNIVSEYLTRYRWFDKELSRHQSKYAKGLIDKYKGNFGVWNIIEIQTFSQFIDLYELYFKKYKQQHMPPEYLDVVKVLRNSIAHNNCLMFNLHKGKMTKDVEAAVAIAEELGFDEQEARELMLVSFLRDLTITLYVFYNIVSSKEERIEQMGILNRLVNERYNNHIDYFSNNSVIMPVIKYMQKLVGIFNDKVQIKNIG